MRFFFHVAESRRDTFDLDWQGKEFDNAEEALGHAQALRSELDRGYVIVTDESHVKVAVLDV